MIRSTTGKQGEWKLVLPETGPAESSRKKPGNSLLPLPGVQQSDLTFISSNLLLYNISSHQDE